MSANRLKKRVRRGIYEATGGYDPFRGLEAPCAPGLAYISAPAAEQASADCGRRAGTAPSKSCSIFMLLVLTGAGLCSRNVIVRKPRVRMNGKGLGGGRDDGRHAQRRLPDGRGVQISRS
jgi:hypothetical protein